MCCYCRSMTPSRRLQLLPGSPAELLVHREPGQCAYLPAQTWLLPLRMPLRDLSHNELDIRLARGDRRQGRLLYSAECPECHACEPIRIDVARFKPNRSQLRTWRRGRKEIRVEQGPVEVNETRSKLFNLHKKARGLNRDDVERGVESYASFLGHSCCDSFEMRYWVGEELLGVAIVDRAESSLSAVYFFWDPKFSPLSPGTFSILEQIELCRSEGLTHLYLGLYIQDCTAMAYKSRFLPHERLIDGQWQSFNR